MMDNRYRTTLDESLEEQYNTSLKNFVDGRFEITIE